MADRVIVQFQRPVDPERVARRAAELRTLIPGATVVRVSPRGRVVLLLETGTDLDAVIESLTALDDVEFAEPDVIDHATPVPDPSDHDDSADPDAGDSPR